MTASRVQALAYSGARVFCSILTCFDVVCGPRTASVPGKSTPSRRGNRGFTSWALAASMPIHPHLTQVYNPDLNRVELVDPAHRRTIAVFATPVKHENVSEMSIQANPNVAALCGSPPEKS